jgi:hypothetical protein
MSATHLVNGEVPQLDNSLLHVVLEEVPLGSFIPVCLVFSVTKAFWEYAMALWLSSHMVMVSVMGALKTPP